jgi:hypothetical protein
MQQCQKVALFEEQSMSKAFIRNLLPVDWRRRAGLNDHDISPSSPQQVINPYYCPIRRKNFFLLLVGKQ